MGTGVGPGVGDGVGSVGSGVGPGVGDGYLAFPLPGQADELVGFFCGLGEASVKTLRSSAFTKDRSVNNDFGW